MNKTVPALIFALLTLAASYTAMAGGAKEKPGPVAIPAECYCTECGMQFRPDSLFASELILKDGKAVFFCDLGDMMLYIESKGMAKAAAVYVKDYISGSWTDGRNAFYLTEAKVRTPMAYGILAFKDRKAAEKFRASSGGGDIFTFDEAMKKGVYR